MACSRCLADPQPEHFGDPRKCAFDDAGNFTPENWNCATIDALIGFPPRNYRGTDPTVVHGDNEQCEVTPTWLDDDSEDHGGWIITTRYKRRGCTSSAIYVGDFHPPRPVTLALVERVIKSRASHEVWRQQYGMPEDED